MTCCKAQHITKEFWLTNQSHYDNDNNFSCCKNFIFSIQICDVGCGPQMY